MDYLDDERVLVGFSAGWRVGHDCPDETLGILVILEFGIRLFVLT